MARKRKCRATHCFHESKEFLPDDEIVEVGACGYHKDCYQAISDIREVVDIFSTQINKNVVFSELRKVINTIVYQRGVDSGMLLFGVKYYLDRRIPLNYPQGLYYVVQNKDVQEQYKKMKIEQKVKDYKFEAPVDESKPFTYNSSKVKGFSDVIGGV